jgi:hypothetical protein
VDNTEAGRRDDGSRPVVPLPDVVRRVATALLREPTG